MTFWEWADNNAPALVFIVLFICLTVVAVAFS